MKRVKARTLIASVIVLALGLAFFLFYSGSVNSEPAAAASQGCVNQGKDPRIAATVICWAQQRLSWKSEHTPHFLLIGNPRGTSVGLAWPPYFVFNTPAGDGQWYMFRIGFRYDRNWRGYIVPTIAWKLISKPLRY